MELVAIDRRGEGESERLQLRGPEREVVATPGRVHLVGPLPGPTPRDVEDVARAGAQGTDHHSGRRRCHHHDHGGTAATLDVVEQTEAVGAGQAVVEQEEIDPIERGAHRAAVLDDHGAHAGPAQRPRHPPGRAFVGMRHQDRQIPGRRIPRHALPVPSAWWPGR